MAEEKVVNTVIMALTAEMYTAVDFFRQSSCELIEHLFELHCNV
jgi:hypothetical protein